MLENECIAAKNAGIQQANLYFLLNSDIDEYINDFCGYALYIGPYMSAHALLNLFNELRQVNKIRGL